MFLVAETHQRHFKTLCETTNDQTSIVLQSESLSQHLNHLYHRSQPLGETPKKQKETYMIPFVDEAVIALKTPEIHN